ncbi:hypothetical protein T265_15425, partial [Opisthorchis viverrini]
NRQSFDECRFPSSWKQVIFTPVYETGDRLLAGRYTRRYSPDRPPSITCKAKRHILKQAMLNRHGTNSLICPTQHGFLPNHSYVVNMPAFMDGPTQVEDKGLISGAIFSDLSNVFDQDSHGRKSSSKAGARNRLPISASSADFKLVAKQNVFIAPCALESMPTQPDASPDGSFYSTITDPSTTKGSDALEDPTVPGNRETLEFRRDHCLMLFGSKESGEEVAQARYNHDLNLLQELVDKLADADEPGIRVRRILRLGKRVAGIHRPLKIVFENADAPKRLLSRAWRLKGMDIYIRPDMDPSQRAQLKAAVVELRRRTLEDSARATEFACHFSSVYARNPSRDSHTGSCSVRLDSLVCCTEKVCSLLLSLNTLKSAGPDGLHPVILKTLAPVIEPAVTTLYNKSLAEGVLPQEWKDSVVQPFPKGGDLSRVTNYRPICEAGSVAYAG